MRHHYSLKLDIYLLILKLYAYKKYPTYTQMLIKRTKESKICNEKHLAVIYQGNK